VIRQPIRDSDEQVSRFGRGGCGDFAAVRLRRFLKRCLWLLTRAAALQQRDDQEVAETTNADAQRRGTSPSLVIGNCN